jgi:hypothetical protein
MAKNFMKLRINKEHDSNKAQETLKEYFKADRDLKLPNLNKGISKIRGLKRPQIIFFMISTYC